MPQHSRIQAVRDALGIKTLQDWTRVLPSEVLAIENVGQVTLDEIRLYLAGRHLTLKDDGVWDHWWKSLGSAAIGTKMADDESGAAPQFTIVIDGRERAPFQFMGLNKVVNGELVQQLVEVEYGRLDSGDYSLAGFEKLVGVERKSLEDLYSTLGSGRERFEREHERLAEMKTACVVVEADWHTVINQPPAQSSLNPLSVLGTSISWYQRYGIAWYMLPGRRAAESFTYKFLEMFYRNHVLRPRKD